MREGNRVAKEYRPREVGVGRGVDGLSSRKRHELSRDDGPGAGGILHVGLRHVEVRAAGIRVGLYDLGILSGGDIDKHTKAFLGLSGNGERGLIQLEAIVACVEYSIRSAAGEF